MVGVMFVLLCKVDVDAVIAVLRTKWLVFEDSIAGLVFLVFWIHVICI